MRTIRRSSASRSESTILLDRELRDLEDGGLHDREAGDTSIVHREEERHRTSGGGLTAGLAAQLRPDLLGGVTVLRGTVRDGEGKPRELLAIPYYAWSHRGPGEMAVWLKRGSSGREGR